MSMIYSEVLHMVENPDPGIPLSHPVLNSNLRIGEHTYIVFAGQSGSGKSSIMNGVFILDLYDWYVKNGYKKPIHWIVRSMERPPRLLVAKWACYKIYKEHQVLLDVPTILGWQNKSRDINSYEKSLLRSYESYFDKLFRHVTIIGGQRNVKEIIKQNETFKERYPEHLFIHISDHVGKLPMTGTQKSTLDTYSDVMANYRDAGWMVVDVMQMNRGIEDPRRRMRGADIVRSDLEGSSKLLHNCDICLGIIDPYALEDNTHMGYEIPKFKSGLYSRFRSLKCIKNTYGADAWRKGFAFYGGCGAVFELPSSREMTDQVYEQVRNCSYIY